MNDEIKEWQTQSVKHKVAYVLMMDGISFRYTEETGIVFSAPDFLCKESYPTLDELLRREFETDYKRI